MPLRALRALRGAAASGLATDVATAGAASCTGDLAAQRFDADGGPISWRRAAAVSSYGAVAAVPYHSYYRWLARAFPVAVLGAWPSLARKLAIDLLIVLPLLEIPAFTLWTGALARGETLAESTASLKREWLAATLGSWGIWAPFFLATFRYVPVAYQLRFVYCAGAVWTCLLSSLTFKGGGKGRYEREGG